MKKVALFASLIMSVSAVEAASYEIDPTHTYPNFEISHLGYSTMHGRFNSTKGSLELDLDKGKGSVDITIDAASIDTAFKKRDDHLRSPDFFNVSEFPEITFKSTKVKFNGKQSASVTGNLSMLGVSKTVTLDVKSITCKPHPFNKKEVCGFDAETKINRSDFGMKYGLPAIGDSVKIHLEVEAIKK